MSNELIRSYVQMTPKDYLRLILEQYVAEWNIFVVSYNQFKPSERWQIGVSFYNSLQAQPKKKACYLSFLERQEDQDPKSHVNVMRFLRKQMTMLEFQTA